VLLMASTANELREEVRRRYAESAKAVTGEGERCGCGSGSCCDDDSVASARGSAKFGEVLYETDQRGELPDAAVLASLGCGNPTAVANLHEGEVVLDLGSGGGIDVILSAKRVGPTGLAYGLDMTDEMLALARRNADEAGIENAIFLKGYRGDSASRRLGRRRDLELRNQSVDRQGGSAAGNRQGASARRADRRQRRCRRGSPD
jgi:SAM-dependent methyltransferase